MARSLASWKSAFWVDLQVISMETRRFIRLAPLAATLALVCLVYAQNRESAGSRVLAFTHVTIVEKGKIADLVLIEGNPLSDIRNVRRIAAVVIGGRMFSKAELQTMLDKMASEAGKK